MNRIVFFVIAAVMCYGACWAKVVPVHEYMQSRLTDGLQAPCFNYPLNSCPTNGVCDKCPSGNKYVLNECISPYVLSGVSCVCPATVKLAYTNDKCVQTCNGNCVKKSCTPSSNQSGCTNGTMKCDNGCGSKTRVCCNACVDLITTKPSNSSYTYASCKDGSGTKQIKNGWQCNNGYYKVGNACEKICNTNSCSGYTLTSCPMGKVCSGCSVVNSDCSSGGKKYKVTGCTAVSCIGYTLTSCPEGTICESCDKINSNCSSGGRKYKAIGCALNWVDTQSYWCAVPQTTDCTALGYDKSSGSCSGELMQFGCPFDKTKFACIELY